MDPTALQISRLSKVESAVVGEHSSSVTMVRTDDMLAAIELLSRRLARVRDRVQILSDQCDQFESLAGSMEVG